MFNFFSDSSKRRRYPNPNRGSSYYKKGGFFGMGSSFSGSGSSRPGRQYGYPQDPYQGQQYGTPQQTQQYGSPQQAQPYGTPRQSQAYPAPQNSAAVCPNCGASVPAGSKFCLSCGAKIASAAFCTNCGKPIPAGAKFCPECGTPAGK